jgi:OOP family OmpA-OmpF porin
MRNTFSRKQARLAAACALALGVISGTVGAQTMAPNDERSLVRDGSGQVVKNGSGECWHSGVGPGPTPNTECGPQPVAPRVVQYTPEWKPVVVAAAPLAVYETVTFDANVLFDFDKSSLLPAGRDTLDGFIAKTRDFINPGAMVAVGYADRIGSGAYNQNLSDERVATVKAYLVSQGIEAKQVGTSGRGESQPTTRGGECSGAGSAKNVACLQPDRHVYIELSGTRIKQ